MTERPAFRSGDLIAWDTWCGTAVASLDYVTPGSVHLRSADGHTEYLDSPPRRARYATEAERLEWSRRALPAFPPGYH